MKLLLVQGLRHHVRHPLQTCLTVLGIAAGVALLCAMQLAQTTAERAFDLGLQAVAGQATHTVTCDPEGLPVATYAGLRARFGGRAMAPSVSAIVRVPIGDQHVVLRVLGIDPLADADLRGWSARGAGAGGSLPLAALMTTSGSFVLVEGLRQRLGVAAGQSLQVRFAGRTLVATCVGTIAPPPVAAAGLADMLLVDIATAQEWTGRVDRIDRIDLRLVPELLPAGTSVESALAAVMAACGPGATLTVAGAREGTLAHLARGFRINLRALNLLSLLVGAFLVHETMRLSVVARRRSFGIVRALGATGRALFAVVAAEAALVGMVGSVLGAGAAVLLSHALLDALVRTLNDHYASFDLQHVDWNPLVLGAGMLAGTVVALLAGLGPAFAASRVPARDVLVGGQHGSGRGVRRAMAVAAPFAVLATVLLTTTGDRLMQAYAGLVALLVAVIAIVPMAMVFALWGLGALVPRKSPFVRYVVRSTAAAREHLGMPVAAMVLALATTLGLGTMVGSFRTSVADWLSQVLPADIYVSVPAGHDEKVRATIVPVVVATLQEAAGPSAFSTYQRTRCRLRGGHGEGDIEVCGMAPTAAVLRGFGFVEGDDNAAREALVRGEGAWVSEPLAFHWGLAVGDRLSVTTPNGWVDVAIVAVHRDYSSERGEVIVGKTWLDAHMQVGVTAVALQARSGVDVAGWAQDLRERTAAVAEQELRIVTNGELRTASLQVFDRSFAITSVMRLLCSVVAFFGIYAAFAALQFERGAEMGLLRCLGARPRQIGMVVLGQVALLGLFAGLCAVPVGALFGHVLVHVINRVSFGWSLTSVSLPWSLAAEIVLWSVGAALLAGLQPALRFARMRPADTLRES